MLDAISCIMGSFKPDLDDLIRLCIPKYQAIQALAFSQWISNFHVKKRIHLIIQRFPSILQVKWPEVSFSDLPLLILNFIVGTAYLLAISFLTTNVHLLSLFSWAIRKIYKYYYTNIIKQKNVFKTTLIV